MSVVKSRTKQGNKFYVQQRLILAVIFTDNNKKKKKKKGKREKGRARIRGNFIICNK
jgi:hypothetical protein